jgi:X-Pro dipeptidyl-peptidase
MTEPRSRRAGIAVALTLACAASLGAQAQARPVFENGMAQVVPAFADSAQWIRQNLWVETGFDSDGDAGAAGT